MEGLPIPPYLQDVQDAALDPKQIEDPNIFGRAFSIHEKNENPPSLFLIAELIRELRHVGSVISYIERHINDSAFPDFDTRLQENRNHAFYTAIQYYHMIEAPNNREYLYTHLQAACITSFFIASGDIRQRYQAVRETFRTLLNNCTPSQQNLQTIFGVTIGDFLEAQIRRVYKDGMDEAFLEQVKVSTDLEILENLFLAERNTELELLFYACAEVVAFRWLLLESGVNIELAELCMLVLFTRSYIERCPESVHLPYVLDGTYIPWALSKRLNTQIGGICLTYLQEYTPLYFQALQRDAAQRGQDYIDNPLLFQFVLMLALESYHRIYPLYLESKQFALNEEYAYPGEINPKNTDQFDEVRSYESLRRGTRYPNETLILRNCLLPLIAVYDYSFFPATHMIYIHPFIDLAYYASDIILFPQTVATTISYAWRPALGYSPMDKVENWDAEFERLDALAFEEYKKVIVVINQWWLDYYQEHEQELKDVGVVSDKYQGQPFVELVQDRGRKAFIPTLLKMLGIRINDHTLRQVLSITEALKMNPNDTQRGLWVADLYTFGCALSPYVSLHDNRGQIAPWINDLMKYLSEQSIHIAYIDTTHLSRQDFPFLQFGIALPGLPPIESRIYLSEMLEDIRRSHFAYKAAAVLTVVRLDPMLMAILRELPISPLSKPASDFDKFTASLTILTPTRGQTIPAHYRVEVTYDKEAVRKKHGRMRPSITNVLLSRSLNALDQFLSSNPPLDLMNQGPKGYDIYILPKEETGVWQSNRRNTARKALRSVTQSPTKAQINQLTRLISARHKVEASDLLPPEGRSFILNTHLPKQGFTLEEIIVATLAASEAIINKDLALYVLGGSLTSIVEEYPSNLMSFYELYTAGLVRLHYLKQVSKSREMQQLLGFMRRSRL